MVAVTQRIDNYLGGVSRQSDDKKLPGQVRECLNGYPDPTFGLTKRPGFKWIANLGTGTTYDSAKWFYISRTSTEKYIGCITPKPTSGNGTIAIWNASTGVACTVTYGTNAQNYLTGARINYDVLTVQDTSIITNNLITAAKQADPAFVANTRATLTLSDTAAGIYKVTVAGSAISPYTASGSETYDSLLTELKTRIDGLSISGLTVTKYVNTLELTRVVSGTRTAFTISSSGGSANNKLTVFQDQVDNVSQLPTQTLHDRVVKIINTASDNDTYFAKFVADNGTSGPGYWEETIDPSKSPGLDAATMPHELVNPSANTFQLRQIGWTARLVGDDTTNPHPSFIGKKIERSFFHNNRLGFLSDDSVSLSQSAEYYNLYHTSAQTVTDADPVDISASTIRPAALHAVIPTTQGLVLFSKNQQFMMFSADGILTPASTIIRTISNYEMDTEVDPVDMGTNINFISKTPGYTRIFGMVTRGQDENPQVMDIGRVVNEWVPATVDTFAASPQNQFIAMSSQGSRYVYFFRTYNDGEKNLVQAWFNWELSGNVQTIALDSDDMFAVTKQGTQFTLTKASLSQSPEDAIIVNNDGQKINPCIDLYATASQVIYNSTDDFSKCYLPWDNITTLTPVLIIKGSTATGNFIESGFTITPTVASETVWQANTAYAVGDVVRGVSASDDNVYTCTVAGTSAGSGGPTGTPTSSITDNTVTWGYTRTGSTYFKVPKKNLTSVASDVIVGWKYDLNVVLPKTYYRLDDPKTKTDFTANLTVSRMKFAVGLSGVMGFKLKSIGARQGSKTYTGDGSTTIFSWTVNDLTYVDKDQIKVTVNNVEETGFTVSGDTQITFSSAPATGAKIAIFLDEWYNLDPTVIADTYLANDIALSEQKVFALPIHQKTDNFQVRVFNDSPFPVSLNSMMWEGNYSPRFYRRK